MKRRALLQLGGAGVLTVLSSCVARPNVDAEYRTLASLPGGVTGAGAGGNSPAGRSSDGRTSDPSAGTGDGSGSGGASDGPERDDGNDGLERDDGADTDDPTDGSGDEDDTEDGSDSGSDRGDGVPGLTDADVRSVVGTGGIEELTISHDRTDCRISFSTTASGGPGLMNDLETVLEAVSVSITDDRAFQSAVDRIVVDFELAQADGRGSAIANPDWAVAYKNESLSMKEYLGKVRENTRRDRDDSDL